MKQQIFIIVGLLGALSFSVKASDDFRTAAVTAIRTLAPEVGDKDIRLLAAPNLLSPLRGVIVLRSTFDPGLGLWEVRLQCVPRTACLPALAIVESPDKNLFRTGTASPTSPVLQVRAGQRKQLLADVGTIRIREAVVCLQSGHAGEQIRVRELNGRKVLHATILPDGSLSIRRTP